MNTLPPLSSEKIIDQCVATPAFWRELARITGEGTVVLLMLLLLLLCVALMSSVAVMSCRGGCCVDGCSLNTAAAAAAGGAKKCLSDCCGFVYSKLPLGAFVSIKRFRVFLGG